MYIIGLQEMMIDGMGPKLSKIVPTLIVWSVWTASGPKMQHQNWSCWVALGLKWSKMVPTLMVWSVWVV